MTGQKYAVQIYLFSAPLFHLRASMQFLKVPARDVLFVTLQKNSIAKSKSFLHWMVNVFFLEKL